MNDGLLFALCFGGPIILWTALIIWCVAPILAYQDERSAALDRYERDRDWSKLTVVLNKDPRLSGGSRDWMP